MAAGGLDAASDLELGQALRDGDEAALAAVYDRHLRGVYDFVARTVGDPFAAEDLTQMTFVRAWEGRQRLRDPARLKAWLFTIAHNLALNHLTRGRKLESIDDRFDLATPAAGPEAEMEAKDAAQLVWAAAASLEPRQYAVLDLSLRRDLPTPEIAEVLGVSSSHAAVLLNRAREALGNAVRYLLVARRRDHCERLASLVPAGLESLTPDQRSSVDRHMRRCPECQGLAHRLTRPAELFGGLLPLPVPGSLRRERRDFVLVAARQQQAAPRPAAAWWPRHPRRDAALAGLAILVLASLLGGLVLNRPAPSLQAAGQSAGFRGPFTFPTGSPGSPSPSLTPSPGASASPGGASGSAVGIIGSGLTAAAGGVHPRGRDVLSGSNASPGTAATPVPNPAPPPTSQPPPPLAAPFAVTSLVLTADDPQVPGCMYPPATVPTFACTFTVQANVVNAQNGSTVLGTLFATAVSTGGVASKQVAFSIVVPAGSSFAKVTVLVNFSFQPCRKVPPPGSSAFAIAQQPNTVVSNQVNFGDC
jgi:RNA polymerase sigma factor (sigma-70 family)